MDHLPPTPPFVNAVIRAMLFHVWCIQFARDYQIEAIFFLVFLKVGMLYLIRKTGEGKSLVLLGMVTVLRGTTIDMVPLLGIGCDRVSKSKRQIMKVYECKVATMYIIEPPIHYTLHSYIYPCQKLKLHYPVQFPMAHIPLLPFFSTALRQAWQ